MAKKIIRLTENDLSKIVKRVIEEQDMRFETQHTRALQNFLNDKVNAKLKTDGLLGDKTKEAVRAYQSKIGVEADGDFGRNTYNSMPEEDKKLYREKLIDQAGLIDKFLYWLGLM